MRTTSVSGGPVQQRSDRSLPINLKRFFTDCWNAARLGRSAADRIKLGLCHCLSTLRQRVPFLPLGGLVISQVGKGEVPSTIPIRVHSEDWKAFFQVFVMREYDWPLQPPRRIVDLGANCGFATLALARRFPDAHIVAVEPHPANVAALRRMIECNHLLVEVIETAIFSTDGETSLHLSEGTIGHSLRAADSRLIGRRAIKVPAISMPTLLKMAGWNGIDLLKIDVEGYEQTLFAGNPQWLAQVHTIIGELHGAYDWDSLAADLKPFGFQIERRAKRRNSLFCASKKPAPLAS